MPRPISLNVENCEKEGQYQLYLLKREKDGISEKVICNVFANEDGRIRIRNPLNLKELELKDFSIDEIDAILIRRDTSILLGGYIEKDNGTIDRFIEQIIPKSETVTNIKEETPSIDEEIIPDTDEETIPDTDEETIRDDQKETASKVCVEIIASTNEHAVQVSSPQHESQLMEQASMEHKREIDSVDESFDLQDKNEDVRLTEQIAESQEDAETDAKFPKEGHENDYESLEYIRRLNYKDQMTDYILSVLKFFPQVQPLKIYLHNYTWWRIDDDGIEPHRGFLPYYNYLMGSDYRYPFLHDSTTCVNQIKKYGHYLFGLYKEKQDTRYYVYGIPGKFNVDEHPFKGITGFNTWYDSIDEIGYWVLYIDPIKGSIIYPINPMVPSNQT